MKLFLLRHSESVQENDITNDFNRTLSINGNNEANLLANFILRRKLNFNKVLCSSSIRTIQTLNILIENNLSSFENIFTTDDLYLASDKSILKLVSKSNFKSLLIIAHNPGISSLISMLNNSEYQDYPTSTLAYFEIDNSRKNLGQASTKFIVTPKDNTIINNQ